MPLNVMDAHFRSFEKLVLPELVRRGIGVLGMKSMANGIILRSKTATPIECLHYALNLPTSVVITGCDSMEILDQAIDAARDVPADEHRRRRCATRENSECRRARRFRAIQDIVDLRFDGDPSRMAGRGAEKKEGADAGVKDACARLAQVTVVRA